mgnify:CR=1 FL=1
MPATAQMHQQQGNCRRCHPADALRLANGRGQGCLELDQHFRREAAYFVIVELNRYCRCLVATAALDFFTLAFQLAFVLAGYFDLLGNLRLIHAGTNALHRIEDRVVELGPSQQVQRT